MFYKGKGEGFFTAISSFPWCLDVSIIKQMLITGWSSLREGEWMHNSLSQHLWGLGLEPDEVMTVAYMHWAGLSPCQMLYMPSDRFSKGPVKFQSLLPLLYRAEVQMA